MTMSIVILYVCLIYLSSYNHGIKSTLALPPPWKILPLVPAPAVTPSNVTSSSSSDSPPSQLAIAYPPFLTPFTGLYPGLLNLYGIPPITFLPLIPASISNETDYNDLILTMMLDKEKKKKEKAKAKASKKGMRTTTSDVRESIEKSQLLQLRKLLLELFQPTTTAVPTSTSTSTSTSTLSSISNETQSNSVEFETTTQTESTSESAALPSSLAEVLKELMQTG